MMLLACSLCSSCPEVLDPESLHPGVKGKISPAPGLTVITLEEVVLAAEPEPAPADGPGAQWLRAAAALRDALVSGALRDYAHAVDALRKQAAAGHGAASYHLAFCLFHGVGVACDRNAGREQCEAASRQGHAAAAAWCALVGGGAPGAVGATAASHLEVWDRSRYFWRVGTSFAAPSNYVGIVC